MIPIENRNLRLALLLLAMAGAAGCATNGGDARERVTHMTGEQIAATPGALSGWDYVSTDQPDRDVLVAAAEAGYAAVVDLRTAGEDRGIDEPGTVESLGMRYVSLPIGPPSDVTFENARELDRILAGIDGPVLLHCQSGNRVGALFALRASEKGAGNAAALEAGREAGLTRYEPAVRDALGMNDP